jgi:predicted solute-binding protein
LTLLLHDSLITASLVHPFHVGWVESGLPWDARSSLSAADVDEQTFALLPSPEIALLHETHVVVPNIAVVAEDHGPIAMRVPVRPDEIVRAGVRLYETSATAELVARATLEAFYGITPSSWSRDDSTEAEVVIVEGAAALRESEGGFSEDLVRAWFILTGQPVVTHVLVAPMSADLASVQAVMGAAQRIGHERRRDVRKSTAERFEVDRERLTESVTGWRFSLQESDRRALLTLLQRGNKGSSFPYTWEIAFAAEPASEHS